jgi:ectoine hydroxylase-related dioxygenase (phytanoyl-CoA dioxygenase family)
MQIFNELSSDALSFYKEQGYLHLRPKDLEFGSQIKKAFDYYSKTKSFKRYAFRNHKGEARHVVDIFRDKKSPAMSIYKSELMTSLIKNIMFHDTQGTYYTHSKVSSKKPGSDAFWYPHQDAGYKAIGDIRGGFAVFVCLELMNQFNGCLEVYPKSHQAGLLPHSRVIENQRYGDAQMKVDSLPAGLDKLQIIAEQGDVIIFSLYTIHTSASSVNESSRYALIAEVEQSSRLRLDDYLKVPIIATGSFTLFETYSLLLQSFFHPTAIKERLRSLPFFSILFYQIRRVKSLVR